MSVVTRKNSDIERLRAFAVLFVVVSHIAWIQAELNERLWVHLQPWTGVDLFFVISGFVVSGAFERDLARFAGVSRVTALLAFYIKRAARILPTAYVSLAFWWVCWMWFNDSQAFGDPWSGDQVTGLLVSNALFFSNYGMVFGVVVPQLGWYWSLCVEEHFYMLYPAFRLVTTSLRQRAKLLFAVVALTVFGIRMLSGDPHVLQQLSHNRFDQLALGVLLFLAWQRWAAALGTIGARLRTSSGAQRAAMAVSLFLLFVIATMPTTMVSGSQLAVSDQVFQMRVGLVVTGVLSFVLVALASFDLDLLSFGSKWIGGALLAIGTRSYALYMYHLPAKWIVVELLTRHPDLFASTMPNGRAILVYVATLAVMVELNYRLIEKPFMAWGRHAVERLVQPDARPARRWRLPWIWVRRGVVTIGMLIIGGFVYAEFHTRAAYEAAARAQANRVIRSVSVAAPSSAVVAYLRAHGEDAVDLSLPSLRYMQPDRTVVAINGASRRPTLLCRGSRGWISYISDEFGFNNPDGAKTAPDVLLLGADAMAGACLPERDAVPALLGADGVQVTNLALPGSGPLMNLAALREFGLDRHPKVVAWVFSEISDLGSLNEELRSPTLLNYLKPGFTQGLRGRISETDGLALADFQARWAATQPGTPLPPVSGASDAVDMPAIPWGHWFDFPALKHARDDRAARTQVAARGREQVDSAFAVPPPPIPAGEAVIPVASYLAAALQRADADVRAAGGRLVFVYLPDRIRFVEGSSFGDGPRPQILKAAADLGIPIADLTELLKRAGDPLDFFEAGPQYNAMGMQLIARGISRATKPWR